MTNSDEYCIEELAITPEEQEALARSDADDGFTREHCTPEQISELTQD